jgi:hypothetical protein
MAMQKVYTNCSDGARSEKQGNQIRWGYTVTRFPNGIVLEAPELFLEKVLDVAWSLPNAFTREL